MSPALDPAPPVVYDTIHFSDRFPVVKAACGKVGPSAGQWRFVTCEACLEAGPDDPRIRQRPIEVRAQKLSG